MSARYKFIMLRVMLALCASALGMLSSCQRDEDMVERGLGFEQFKPVYNRYIQGWLELT